MSNANLDNILDLVQALDRENQDALVRRLREKRKAAKAALDPKIQELSSAISRLELRRQLILEQDIEPLQEQLRALGLRRLGPTVAHRWIDAKMAISRGEWQDLPKPEQKVRADAKRREIRESDEFARLFPAEAHEARKEAGIRPFISIETEPSLNIDTGVSQSSRGQEEVQDGQQ